MGSGPKRKNAGSFKRVIGGKPGLRPTTSQSFVQAWKRKIRHSLGLIGPTQIGPTYLAEYLPTDVRLDNLRSDPRFADLRWRVGISE